MTDAEDFKAGISNLLSFGGPKMASVSLASYCLRSFDLRSSVRPEHTMFWAKLNNAGVQGESGEDFSQVPKSSSIVSLTHDVDSDCVGIVIG